MRWPTQVPFIRAPFTLWNVLIILRNGNMFSVEFSCGNGGVLVWSSCLSLSQGGQEGKASQGPPASVYRGVGVPSAAQNKKVHAGLALLASAPGAGKPPKYSLSSQMPSVDH